jgi:hypothetical protein
VEGGRGEEGGERWRQIVLVQAGERACASVYMDMCMLEEASIHVCKQERDMGSDMMGEKKEADM